MVKHIEVHIRFIWLALCFVAANAWLALAGKVAVVAVISNTFLKLRVLREIKRELIVVLSTNNLDRIGAAYVGWLRTMEACRKAYVADSPLWLPGDDPLTGIPLFVNRETYRVEMEGWRTGLHYMQLAYQRILVKERAGQAFA